MTKDGKLSNRDISEAMEGEPIFSGTAYEYIDRFGR